MKNTSENTDKHTDSFFETLGLKQAFDPETPEFWEDLWRDISDAGINPHELLENFHPMSHEIADMYFMNEKIGLKFLSADIGRFRSLVKELETRTGFPKSPERIIEPGGGPGIISLWLASKFPDSECIVYDISDRALELGRKFATRMGIENISYHKAGYRDLCRAKNLPEADLVLGLSALYLKIYPEDGASHFSIETDPCSFSCQAGDMAADFVTACSRLVKPGGLFYFSQGAFNDLGLLYFFSAMRKNGFGIDWELSEATGETLDGSDFSFNGIHIFARSDLQPVFHNAREDLRVFLHSGKIARNDVLCVIGHADFEVYYGLLADGLKISEIVTRKDNGTLERFSIFCKSGMLGFFSSSSSGRRSGFTGAAAGFRLSASRLKSAIDKYRENEIEIVSEYWHPALKF